MKYLIVYLFSGLNDRLCEINKCLEYASIYNRMVIIGNSRDILFGSEIIDLLMLEHPNITNKKIDEVINNNYILYNVSLDSDYSEDVITYSKIDWGNESHNLVKHFKFHNTIKEQFKIRYNQIPKPYISIHIRYTDRGRRLDIQKFLDDNKEVFNNNAIFLACDNIEVIQLIKKKYNNVYSFADIKEVIDRQGQHTIERTTEDKILYNIDTICDLLLLANGDKYIYSCCDSGFSLLAKYMFENIHTHNNIYYKNLIN